MNKQSKVLALLLLCTSQFNPVIAHEDHSHSIPVASTSAVQMNKAAKAFIQTLTPEQKAEVILPFENDALRTSWSNAPVHSKARNGLPIGRFSLEQRHLLHELLIASTSSQGYQKVWGAVRGDDELKREGENRMLDSAKFFGKNQSLGAIDYWLSFYGDPNVSAKWSYMLTGHHLAANFTVVDDKATFVPMFYGADPAVISEGAHAGHPFLPQERKRGVELLMSLTDKQKAIAVVADAYPSNKFGPIDFAGPGKKDSKRKYQGLKASDMTSPQQKLLWVLIEEYVRNADFDVAERQLSKIKNDGLSALHFMWMGPTDGSEKLFYRVHGPSILIDFVDQRTGFDWNTHPHVIVRDPSNDYGEDWLQRHIMEQH